MFVSGVIGARPRFGLVLPMGGASADNPIDFSRHDGTLEKLLTGHSPQHVLNHCKNYFVVLNTLPDKLTQDGAHAILLRHVKDGHARSRFETFASHYDDALDRENLQQPAKEVLLSHADIQKLDPKITVHDLSHLKFTELYRRLAWHSDAHAQAVIRESLPKILTDVLEANPRLRLNLRVLALAVQNS